LVIKLAFSVIGLSLLSLTSVFGFNSVQADEISPSAFNRPSVLPVNLVAQQSVETTETAPRVAIIATGGTIANSPDGRMSIDTVLEEVPEIAEVAEIEVIDYARIGSSSLSVQNLIDLARLVNDTFAAQPDLSGIVITHGSNSAEETAYFLSLVTPSEKPVVVVGAQRQRDTLSEDGSRNLYDAVRVAASPDAQGLGAVMVVNETIHAARDVTKTTSYRVETWNSGDLGALGLVDTDRLVIYRKPSYRHSVTSEFSLDGITEASQLPRVDILYTYVGADGVLVDAAVNQGNAQGLIIAGYPTGAPARPDMEESLDAHMANGVAVVMSHRGGRGRIRTGDDYISADNLTPQKARLLLMLALTQTSDPQEIQRIFNEY
jgi:L-asparaginase